MPMKLLSSIIKCKPIMASLGIKDLGAVHTSSRFKRFISFMYGDFFLSDDSPSSCSMKVMYGLIFGIVELLLSSL